LRKEFTIESKCKPYSVLYDYTINPADIYKALSVAADAAKREGNLERVLELWKMQQAFAIESKSKPYSGLDDYTISPDDIHKALADAAKREGNPERVLELWKMQQAFAIESKSKPYSGLDDYTINPADIHKLFQSIINSATTPDTKGRSSELWEMQKNLL